ncbi:fungal-specific transcription factor domain-containing protein [Cladorrhinum sp. PSN332]|nr:fungal-specific transcription factor domain-containing protein [Cladorrhinum sp. PSN332]
MSGTVNLAVSCVECQRRKQKCNRQFPCNHCLKRGVSHLCRIGGSKPVTSKAGSDEPCSSDSQSRTCRKRTFDDSDEQGPADHDDEPSGTDISGALNALGYLAHHHHLVLGNRAGSDTLEKPTEQSEELKATLELMPAKPYTDCLVDNWLNGANHHYYALYPPEFRTQYDGWWANPSGKVTPELTSLILRVCACSLHFIIDNNVRVRLETELKTNASTFAQRMHVAADKLSMTIPPGKGGLVHVQQLFLTAFWYKSAEKWTEAWHALSRAIRAANEIGLHRDSLSEGMSEFDREMRRRLWCVLYMWDFALGSMLSRPLLINHADCTFEMPTLALEVDPERPHQPSPFRHMVLHSQLCLDMLAQLGPHSGAEAGKVAEAGRLRDVILKFFKNLPPEYSREHPDTQWDSELDWVVFQRRYLHLIGNMCLFGTLKPFVTSNSGASMTEDERSLRKSGVQAALDLMDISWGFFENMVTAGAKFHYAIFCIFDTTTAMCSAFVHDKAHNLPQRERVLEAIQQGLHMLQEARAESKTTSDLYRILKRLLADLPLSTKEKGLIGVAKRSRANNLALQAPAGGMPTGSPESNPLARRILSDSAKSRRNGSTSSRSESTTLIGTGTPPLVKPGCIRPEPPVGNDHLVNVSISPPVGSMPQYGQSAGLVPASNYVSSDGFVPPNEFQYHQHDFSLAPPESHHFNQPTWQSPPNSEMVPNMAQASEIGPFGESAPTVLEYWDWEALGFGPPVYWGHVPQGPAS